ncbi:hypothetical protein [uncultured Aquimarina sp.]|uniref:hypothetical protein n=1 Tax=uncultured Aquimarina sp. TaxID=575652 RepID=UPI00260AFB63|nr:hypothetical protein [uncultured Aquimarina sp.]
MKTKKIIWGLLISLIMISCSTDDSETFDEQLEVNAKLSIFAFNPDFDFGMPLEDHDLTEPGIIKIGYYTNDPDTRFLIRKEFSEKYPSLVLVSPSALPDTIDIYHPYIEYWYVNPEEWEQNIVVHPEEDDDLTPPPAPLIAEIKEDITNHYMIDLYNEGDIWLLFE